MKLQLNLESEWHQIFFVFVFQIEMQVCFFFFCCSVWCKEETAAVTNEKPSGQTKMKVQQ